MCEAAPLESGMTNKDLKMGIIRNLQSASSNYKFVLYFSALQDARAFVVLGVTNEKDRPFEVTLESSIPSLILIYVYRACTVFAAFHVLFCFFSHPEAQKLTLPTSWHVSAD